MDDNIIVVVSKSDFDRLDFLVKKDKERRDKLKEEYRLSEKAKSTNHKRSRPSIQPVTYKFVAKQEASKLPNLIQFIEQCK